MQILKKISDSLFSTRAAGLYMVLFAAAIGIATFIENDFGTSAAQKVIFKARWFELLLVLFGISLIVNIFRYRMIQQKKWAILTFHASMIIILIGAGVTRYFGYEGVMHIREGAKSNSFLSADTYLNFEAEQDDKKYAFNEPVLFASLGSNNFHNSYQIGNDLIEVELMDFIPNPEETVIVDEANGVPTIKVVFGGANGREEYYIRQGDRRRLNNVIFNFSKIEMPGAFNIKFENGNIFFKTNETVSQMVMATQTRDSLAGGMFHPLMLRSLYATSTGNFVFGDFHQSARVEMTSSDVKMASNSLAALDIAVRINGDEQRQLVYGTKGMEGNPRVFRGGNTDLAISYGSRRVVLPFAVELYDFQMERYPGTESASSYASEVALIDPRVNFREDHRIYMNHILDYDGFRFFQSSFDKDELGTYLSVNHDFWGTWISYIGYILLTIGMIMTFFDTKSRFRKVGEQIKSLRKRRLAGLSTMVLLAMLVLPNQTQAFAPIEPNTKTATEAHADAFGNLLVQDYKGRIKPLNTFNREIVRKLSRKESLYGLTADQVILGMAAFPELWYAVPMIKLGKNEAILAKLNVDGKLASYNDFFDGDGQYLIKDMVRAAYNTPQKDRGTLEKELMKLDEKVNIASMVFSGRFLKVFPVPEDENNTWVSPVDMPHQHDFNKAQGFAQKFYPAYIPTLRSSVESGDWKLSNALLTELAAYQYENGAAVIPSETKIKAELLLNDINVFSRLGKLYGLLGLGFLVLLFMSVFSPGRNLQTISTVLFGILAVGFLFHTFGLGLRWYVSGRAPWSNGYESMIYIGWTTVLAGLIFSRKSLGGLTATSVLAATIMMVAGLSFLDPEITPLVPVLKSYWLTIHVSLEAGSYGFLMLGAIIGILNLIFYAFATPNNQSKVTAITKEMTLISEMTLIGGLFMISIGTYLGGVWANESWGRYWGWDAKETWALVTILVYAFILHMRMIPGMRGTYAFNVASLFGLASVLMTYYGVNYYLSGLHSYAAGDPVPIPSWVYYSAVALTVLSLFSYWKKRKLDLS